MGVPAILKASNAYPPWSWSEINDQIEEAGPHSKHELWLDMTERYAQSMATKKQQRMVHKLSNTMPKEKYQQMPIQIQKRQDFVHDLTNESAQVCGYILDLVEDYQSMKKYTRSHQMETIPEKEEVTTSYSYRLSPIEQYIEQHVRSKLPQYCHLLMSDGILPTFHKRLREIVSKYEDYKSCLNKYDRPSFGPLLLLDDEVEEAKENCQRRLQTDTKELKRFLAGCLLKEYVPPTPNPTNGKSPVFMQYGTYLYWQGRKGHNRDEELDILVEEYQCSKQELHDFFGEGLNMTIRACKLDKGYVKDRIEEYFEDRHLGRWQRYVREQRWEALAKKLLIDRMRLDAFIDEEVAMPKEGEKMTLKCQISTNMRLVRSKYFKRLDGPQDFELTKTALAMVKKRAEAEAKLARIEKKKAAGEVERMSGLTNRTSEPSLTGAFLPR
ncbi:MAG: hypothetical protein Q9217_004593, partial [Psora testacea]